MATSALVNYVDRSGFSLLQANHSMSGNMAETFTFPSGTWAVHGVTAYVDSTSDRSTMGYKYSAMLDATSVSALVAQDALLWHQTSSAAPLEVLPHIHHANFYSYTDSKFIDTWTYGSSHLDFQPSDQLYVEGPSLGGNIFVSVTALRLV